MEAADQKQMENNKSHSRKPPVSPGRPPGVPNKATSRAREMIAHIADNMAQDFQSWMMSIAYGVRDPNDPTKWETKPNPAEAAKIYMSALEYHIPKLQRTEIAGDPGSAPVIIKIIDDIPRS